jgi:hypothetical protein
MNKLDKDYTNLLQDILDNGVKKEQQEISEEAKKRAANYMSLKGALEPKDVVLGYKTSLDAQMLDSHYVDFSNPNADKITSNTTSTNLSFKERCRIGNYTPFNIENLMGELSKKKKENYLTQEEFEEFHNTIMDGLKIPRYGK